MMVGKQKFRQAERIYPPERKKNLKQMFHVEQFPPEKRMVSPEKATSDYRSGRESYSGIMAAVWRLKLIFIGFMQCSTWNSACGKRFFGG